MNNQIQTSSKLRDLAAQIALNFVGHVISSADGSYDLLIQVIYDAVLQVDREARGDERSWIRHAIRIQMREAGTAEKRILAKVIEILVRRASQQAGEIRKEIEDGINRRTNQMC